VATVARGRRDVDEKPGGSGETREEVVTERGQQPRVGGREVKGRGLDIQDVGEEEKESLSHFLSISIRLQY